MNMPFRVALLLCAATLAACGTAKLDVDLTVGGAFAADRLQGTVAAVELLDEQGELHKLDLALDSDDELDITSYGNGASLRLAEDAELPAGHYTGLRVRFNSPATLRLEDGTVYTLTQQTSGGFAALDLTLADSESANLVVVMDLRFSLADQRSSSGSFDFSPVLSAYLAEDGASVQGRIGEATLDAAGCRSSGTLRAGAAIYAFAGSAASPSDYARDRSPNPLASTSLELDDGDYVYTLPTLAAGSYTLALTCDADSDSADAANGIGFSNSRAITLDEGEAATLNIGS